MSDHLGDRLSADVDGALLPEEAVAFAAHLAECDACHGALEDLLTVRRLLRAVPAPAPHPALLPRTLAKLQQPSPRGPSRRWIVATASAIAAATLALQAPLLPGPHPDRQASVWFFQQHARLASYHPMADVTLTSYLSSAFPYAVPPVGGER